MGNEGSKASVAITVDIGTMPFGTAGAGFGSRIAVLDPVARGGASVLDEFYRLDEDD
jgi:hypothetical protein